MSLEDLGNIGELVAAIGVIASLVYLAVQIQQNTRSVRAATHHSLARSASETQNVFAQSNAMARIFHTAAREPDRLTGEESVQFDAMVRSLFMWYEDLFFQRRDSMVAEEVWEARRRSLLDHLKHPGVASWWGRHSELFARSFVSHTDQIAQQAILTVQADEADTHS